MRHHRWLFSKFWYRRILTSTQRTAALYTDARAAVIERTHWSVSLISPISRTRVYSMLLSLHLWAHLEFFHGMVKNEHIIQIVVLVAKVCSLTEHSECMCGNAPRKLLVSLSTGYLISHSNKCLDGLSAINYHIVSIAEFRVLIYAINSKFFWFSIV